MNSFFMVRTRRFATTLPALALLGLLSLASPEAQAGFILGDAANYIILYEGGSSGSQLSVNNFGTTGIWTGDIGIAGVGKLAATGPGTLNGNINFAAPDTGQASISNTTINGSVNYGVAQVQTDMNQMNALSSFFAAEAGPGVNIAINTNVSVPGCAPNLTGNVDKCQTILTNTGFLDADGNRVFEVTSFNSGNGENLILQSDGSQNVVFDIGFNTQFHGNVFLQDLTGKFLGDAGYAGLTPNQVLFNMYNGAALVGGDTLDANNNGNAAHPANYIYGTFLDPNGPVSFVNTRFFGHIFGGDSVNMQIVSGDTLTLPLPPTRQQQDAPEPSTLALLGLAALGMAGVRRTHRRIRGRALH